MWCIGEGDWEGLPQTRHHPSVRQDVLSSPIGGGQDMCVWGVISTISRSLMEIASALLTEISCRL